MPRKKTVSESTPVLALEIPIIHPNSVFTSETFRRTFGLRVSSLRREVRERRLRVYKRCGRYFILGEDVLTWLRGGAVERQPREHAG